MKISPGTKRRISLHLLATVYVLAGINHFRSYDVYQQIMPAYIPYPYAMIYLTGILEAILGILLLFTKTRRLAAWGIIALLVFVFPANIQMVINYINENNPKIWIAVLRLPLQIPLIYWAWTFTPEPIDIKGANSSAKDTYPLETSVSKRINRDN